MLKAYKCGALPTTPQACKGLSSMRKRVSLPKRPYVLCPYYGLKNEGRIVAMVMIMGLALMVYSIAERKLREALGRQVRHYRIRRVFQVFEGITVLYRGSKMVAVLNMKPIHYKVLSLLGHEYEQMYCADYG